MKIGIDIDDTICSTNESLVKYQDIFIKDKNISSDILWNSNDFKVEFLNKYLKDIYANAKVKDNCIKVLNKLYENNELYIITARTTSFVNDIIEVIKDYLDNYNIKVDGIFINGKDKVDVCIKNNIDVMIDDSYYNYERLVSNGIDAILFDDLNRYKNISRRIENWNEVIEILENIK